MAVQTDASVRPLCIGHHDGLIGELSPKLKEIRRNLSKTRNTRYLAIFN